MTTPDYRPHLPTDPDYLEKVAKSVTARETFEEIHFEYLNEFLQSLNFEENPYDLVSVNAMNSPALQSLLDEVFNDLKSTILTTTIRNSLYQLWDYLAEEDTMEGADVIFVFGGAGVARAEHATKLFQLGLAPKILFTGKHASYMTDTDLSEAEVAADFAQHHGVPKENIILETDSKNTPENAINGIRMLRESGELPHSVILVTNQHHMRRSYHSFKAALDFPVQLIRQPCIPEKFNRETFFKNKEGFSYVVYEYLKMYGARLMKHF